MVEAVTELFLVVEAIICLQLKGLLSIFFDQVGVNVIAPTNIYKEKKENEL